MLHVLSLIEYDFHVAHTPDPWEQAEKFGIDTSLVAANLTLSYEKRIERHERALELVREMLKAREKLYGTDTPLAGGSGGQRD